MQRLYESYGLAKGADRADLIEMVKATIKTDRSGKTSKFVGTSRVLGTTKDGVNILKPRGRPTHFTAKELRDAILAARTTKTA